MSWNGNAAILAGVVILLGVASFGCLSDKDDEDDDLLVETTHGCVRGIRRHPDGQRAWLGIPYAKKPLGLLRFAHPQSVDDWGDTVLDAKSPPNACMQSEENEWLGYPKKYKPNTNISEDCLYLNVHSPRTVANKSLPVFVWFYGGGFSSGSASLDVYNPAQLVKQGLVFVAMQYRLNFFGFLYLGQDSGAPGNAGLMDQVMALEWIKENIANFGGDPNDVTLAGESAGAHSVVLHMESPLSNRLFSKVILQSGRFDTKDALLQRREEAKENFGRLAEHLGCPSGSADAVVKCLRGLDAPMLLEHLPNIRFNFGPVPDGLFLPREDQSAQHHQEKRSKKPMLVGTNANEAALFLITDNHLFQGMFPFRELSVEEMTISHQELKNNVRVVLKDKGYTFEFLDKIASFYSGLFRCPTANFRASEQAVSDCAFVCPVEAVARAHARDGGTVFRYIFAHRASDSPYPSYAGVTHGQETDFTFGKPLFAENLSKYTKADLKMAEVTVAYWTNFEKDGFPHSEGSPIWPQFNSTSGWKSLKLDGSDGTRAQGDVYGEKCDLWEKVYSHVKSEKEPVTDPLPKALAIAVAVTCAGAIAFGILLRLKKKTMKVQPEFKLNA